MHKFIYKITQRILDFQVFLHKKRLERLRKQVTKGAIKNVLVDDVSLDLTLENENKKAQVGTKVKFFLEKTKNNPEAMLALIKEEGTDVYRIKHVNKFLNFIGEEEGFIPPLKGINAFFLNLFINFVCYKKIVVSFKSNEMFVLRPLMVDVYSMVHQLYLWCAFKSGLAGYDLKNRKKFKQILLTMKDKDISNLSLDEVLDMKDAISRDIEAIDFVVNLAKESEASTKLLNKLKDGKSVKL